ncbi:hypothetical protein JOC86_004696 [Bacillus pakistanensis]|uniref:Uncharacterized protein n=1 Tax=Rossellomorea pakistanensis TaxID=992288 RepID=A0ABS2NJS7_9BACI|nr:hypothetical protein [Bacillus pakistanensis]
MIIANLQNGTGFLMIMSEIMELMRKLDIQYLLLIYKYNSKEDFL